MADVPVPSASSTSPSCFSLHLPPGSRDGVVVLNECSAKVLARLSQRVLAALPVQEDSAVFTQDERQQMAELLGVAIAEINSAISVVVRLFSAIIYHQPKMDVIDEALVKAGFSAGATDAFVRMWTELGRETTTRVAEISCTGLPRVRDVDWTIVRTVDGSAGATPRRGAHSLLLALTTDQGVQKMRLTHAEARAAYEALNQIQAEVDRLLE